MPWRGVGDPYRVWISEIMLQQTTVAAVIPYFERFISRFPTLESVAEADEQDVLAAWEGLGYYSRGRNIHRAARAVVETLGGRLPDDVESLRKLPGIGRYTAGAIASFAYGKRAPILEANTQRLYARVIGYRGDPRTKEGQGVLWKFAETILPMKEVGRFNQGLIDLGAMVCVPVNPRCEDCPLKGGCRAFRDGLQGEIPPPRVRPNVTDVYEAVFAVRRSGRWLVRQRSAGERWAGMWDFPRLAIDEPVSRGGWDEILRRFQKASGLVLSEPAAFPVFRHSVTRYRVHLSRVSAEATAGEWTGDAAVRWLPLAALAELPMPMAARAFVNELEEESAPFALRGEARGRKRR
jgi:A/G-specific adenine glycosylase